MRRTERVLIKKRLTDFRFRRNRALQAALNCPAAIACLKIRSARSISSDSVERN
jgi:hypothetical protein